jgi:hypothetical protein
VAGFRNFSRKYLLIALKLGFMHRQWSQKLQGHAGRPNVTRFRFAALAAMVICVGGVTGAQALEYEISVTPDRDVCWQPTYRPERVVVNTRGRLVRPPARSMAYDLNYQASGGLVRNSYHPGVYVETQRVVEPEHYSLSPTACPPRTRG